MMRVIFSLCLYLVNLTKSLISALLIMGYLHSLTSYAWAAKPTISKAEREKTIQILRDYLLEHPEFLFEVQNALLAKEEQLRKEFQKTALSQAHKDIYHNDKDIILGNKNGSKVIVEFFDYNCHYCKQNIPVINELLQKDNQIKLILKDLPILGEDSIKAHIVSRAFYLLKPEKFLEFYEKMLKSPSKVNEDKALAIAQEFNLSKEAIAKKSQEAPIMQIFMANTKLAQKLRINGTPAYIINDEILPGAINSITLQDKLKAAKTASKAKD